MKPIPMFILIFLTVFCVTGALSADGVVISKRISSDSHLGVSTSHVADENPIDRSLIYSCDFEGSSGGSWYTEDRTVESEGYWNVSDFNAANLDLSLPDNHAWYCGMAFPPCPGDPVNMGYGNLWREHLEWNGLVAVYDQPVEVRVTADMNVDTEAGYDYLELRYLMANETWNTVATWDGTSSGILVDVLFTVQPEDFNAYSPQEVQLRWSFESDGGWSDQDCGHITVAGAAQIDNIAVTFDQGSGPVPIGGTETCEGASTLWHPAIGVDGFGDYAHEVDNLLDRDPFHSNYSNQMTFVADYDMEYFRALPPQLCLDPDFCYGPGGHIVNCSGGLNQGYIYNAWVSPPFSSYNPYPIEEGITIQFDVYRHENLAPDSPGIFYFWEVRSTADPTGATGWTSWRDRNTIYYGGPGYLTVKQDVSDLLVNGHRFIQVALGVVDSPMFESDGQNGSPAPYFDNIIVDSYVAGGPKIISSYSTVGMDAYPAIGALDMMNPENNNILFRNYQGDPVSIKVIPIREGAVLYGIPQLHYEIRPNPLFAPYRLLPPLSGAVDGTPDPVVADKWNFSLPDDGFLFPGDLMQYYFSAQDAIAGSSILESRYPASQVGFGVFPEDSDFQFLEYPKRLEIAALPGLDSFSVTDQRKILFWNDNCGRGGDDEWYYALANLGYLEGREYDRYDTFPNDEQGLGCGASLDQLSGYEVILYSSGNQSIMTMQDLTRGDCDDVGLMESWLDGYDKRMFLTGNGLASDLANGNGSAWYILSDCIGVECDGPDVRDFINCPPSILVQSIDSNSLIPDIPQWMAWGGPPVLNRFDAIQPMGPCESLAGFTDYSGQLNTTYSAGTRHFNPALGSDIVFLPYDFSLLWNDLDISPGSLPIRAQILENFLDVSGYSPGYPTPTTQDGIPSFRMSGAYPNPFNPRTRFDFEMPTKGHLSIRIFDVRGNLVTILLDEIVDAGPGSVDWLGTDQAGRLLSSGTYLCVSRTGEDEEINKVSLVR